MLIIFTINIIISRFTRKSLLISSLSCHTGRLQWFGTIPKFKRYRQTDIQTLESHDDDNISHFRKLHFRKDNHYSPYITVLPVFVHSLHMLKPADRVSRYVKLIHLKVTKTPSGSVPLSVITIWRTRWFDKQQSTSLFKVLFMGTGILCIVFGDVCLRYRVREKVLFNCRR